MRDHSFAHQSKHFFYKKQREQNCKCSDLAKAVSLDWDRASLIVRAMTASLLVRASSKTVELNILEGLGVTNRYEVTMAWTDVSWG